MCTRTSACGALTHRTRLPASLCACTASSPGAWRRRMLAGTARRRGMHWRSGCGARPSPLRRSRVWRSSMCRTTSGTTMSGGSCAWHATRSTAASSATCLRTSRPSLRRSCMRRHTPTRPRCMHGKRTSCRVHTPRPSSRTRWRRRRWAAMRRARAASSRRTCGCACNAGTSAVAARSLAASPGTVTHSHTMNRRGIPAA